MNSYAQEILKPLKIVFILVIFEIIFFLPFLSALFSSYNKNLFEIKVNNELMNCYYTEKYNNTFLINASSRGYNSVENLINKIDLKDFIILDISEYEVYYKSGRRKEDTNNWLRESSLNYKKVINSEINIEIKRKNKVLYKGKYIKDISKYIKEKGRYYIHIYSKRKDNILSSVKTHISFNVIVGGGNYE